MMVDSRDVRLDEISNWRKHSHNRVQEKWDTLAVFKDDRLLLMKFNDLAHNQSIMYETDMPDENQNYKRKVENEDINHIETDVCKTNIHSMNSDIDFSDAFNKPFKIEPKLRYKCLELAAQGEKETPLQKYYRLKFEAEELLQEANSQNDDYEKQCTNIGLKIQSILGKLSNFNIDAYLKQLNCVNISEINNLQNFIELLNKIHIDDKEQFINKILPVLNNKVILSTSTNKLKTDQSSQISKLEKRLQKLDIIIGSDTCTLKRLCNNNRNGIVESVKLLKKISKVNLPQVNVIESCVINLLPKLEQIEKLNDYNLKIDEKINELHEIIFKAKNESCLLPNVLKRIKMLEIFYHTIDEFTVKMNDFNEQNSDISKGFQMNELLLNNIETDITKNITNVVSHLQSLNLHVKVFGDQFKNINV